MTADVLNGSPRLNNRRLAVGDVVSQLDVSESLDDCLSNYTITVEQVKDCLEYCKQQQCLKDQPNKYCHNCTLRVKQDGDSDGEEQDNWKRADRLFIKWFHSSH